MASTTKLMTAFSPAGTSSLDDVVTAAPYDARARSSRSWACATASRCRSTTCSTGSCSQSGNDAAQTLAVASAGSEDAFVREMNRTAAKLGLDETSYENPIGFDAPASTRR